MSVVALLLLSLFVPPSGAHAPVAADAMRVESAGADAPRPLRRIATSPRPAAQPAITSDERPAQLGSKILFVNFDGGSLNACGNDDPHDNCTTIFPGTVEPYSGDAANRAAVIQTVRKRVADFGITVTDQRPGSGDYDMEMVGNWQGSNPDFAGIAPAGDCWDNYGGETSFTLEVSTSADAIAEIMLQELAHTWGLDHVDDKADLLYPTTEGSNKTFVDDCFQVVDDVDLNPGQGFCDHHVQACGNYSHQNSHAELLLIFGPSQPDTSAPIVEILAPADGATVEGNKFDLELGLQDDQLPAVIKATVTIDGPSLPEPLDNDGAFVSPSELKFPIMGLPDGEYTIRVDITDESDNPASDMIAITVVGSDAPPVGDSSGGGEAGSGGEASGGGTGDGGGDDDGGASEATGDLGQDGGGRGSDEGCACTSGGTAWAVTPWALLLLGALRRPRRRGGALLR